MKPYRTFLLLTLSSLLIRVSQGHAATFPVHLSSSPLARS
jgi:hypothetical protein